MALRDGLTQCATSASMSRMTMENAPGAAGSVPVLTQGWRLQMALRQADMSVHDMADELGVSRSSLSRWMNDRGTPPRAAFVKQWALRTGVPYTWLATGEAENPRPGDPDGGSAADPALCARRDSNPQPSDP